MSNIKKTFCGGSGAGGDLMRRILFLVMLAPLSSSAGLKEMNLMFLMRKYTAQEVQDMENARRQPVQAPIDADQRDADQRDADPIDADQRDAVPAKADLLSSEAGSVAGAGQALAVSAGIISNQPGGEGPDAGALVRDISEFGNFSQLSFVELAGLWKVKGGCVSVPELKVSVPLLSLSGKSSIKKLILGGCEGKPSTLVVEEGAQLKVDVLDVGGGVLKNLGKIKTECLKVGQGGRIENVGALKGGSVLEGIEVTGSGALYHSGVLKASELKIRVAISGD